MTRPLRRAVLVALILVMLLAGTMLRSFMFTVDEREMAVTLQFGRPVGTYTEPGLYFKLPIVQQLQRLPKTHQFWVSAPGEVLVDLPTADGKKIEVTPWAVWRITDPVRFVQVLRTVENAQSRVTTFVRGAVRDVVTSYPLVEVVRSTDRVLTYSLVESPQTLPDPVSGAVRPADLAPTQTPVERVKVGRKRLVERIRQLVHDRLAESGEAGLQGGRGIELVDVGISRIEFVEVVREAAFGRLIAFMESIASRHVSEGERRKQEILNRTEAEVQRILGEGSEEANGIRGQVEAEIIGNYARALTETGDFYTFLRTLEVYEQALGDKTRLILSTDSDLLQMLKGPPGVQRRR